MSKANHFFMKKAMASFGTIVAIMGSVLISVGVAWFLAKNWHQIPSFLKIIILLGFTSAAYIAGVMLPEKGYNGTGKALLLLGGVLYTLSIFLIAQIFFTSSSLQGQAWLWLIAFIGIVISTYFFKSVPLLIVSILEFMIWTIVQFSAFSENFKVFSGGVLTFLFLVIGVLFYSLYLFHTTKKHAFAAIYQWWTLFYFLLFTFILTFQLALPNLWTEKISFFSAPVVFVLIMAVVSVMLFIFGIKYSLENKKDMSKVKEIIAVVVLLVVLVVFLLSTMSIRNEYGYCQTKECYSFQSKENCEKSPAILHCAWNDQVTGFEGSSGSCAFACSYYYNQSSCESANQDCVWQDYYCNPRGYNPQAQQELYSSCQKFNNNKESCDKEELCAWYSDHFFASNSKTMPLNLWVFWILINVLFIGVILAVIGYGTIMKSSAIINIGIVFFVLDIVSRYIGFIMDFGGYVGLSAIFISGGILLLGGGYLIEKWRKQLLENVK
ncbi:DUF2157 domain-containing protein [Candidatus Woesearchaeota archaeon]|nr:DUF2157 domain-containing protein [Candidatus Woesearchaeota archaeon]